MAKDELAAKPLVLYEGDDMVALASEEMAIRAVIDHEIETYDPVRERGDGMDTVTADQRTSRASTRAGSSSSTSVVPRVSEIDGEQRDASTPTT